MAGREGEMVLLKGSLWFLEHCRALLDIASLVCETFFSEHA